MQSVNWQLNEVLLYLRSESALISLFGGNSSLELIRAFGINCFVQAINSPYRKSEKFKSRDENIALFVTTNRLVSTPPPEAVA
jgi:hypothetical protein